jgi:hypothetical protein
VLTKATSGLLHRQNTVCADRKWLAARDFKNPRARRQFGWNAPLKSGMKWERLIGQYGWMFKPSDHAWRDADFRKIRSHEHL